MMVKCYLIFCRGMDVCLSQKQCPKRLSATAHHHILVWYVCFTYECVSVRRGLRTTLASVFLAASTLFSGIRFLIGQNSPRMLGWLVWEPQEIILLPPLAHHWDTKCTWLHPAFHMFAGDWTQVLELGWRELFWLNYIPGLILVFVSLTLGVLVQELNTRQPMSSQTQQTWHIFHCAVS